MNRDGHSVVWRRQLGRDTIYDRSREIESKGLLVVVQHGQTKERLHTMAQTGNQTQNSAVTSKHLSHSATSL